MIPEYVQVGLEIRPVVRRHRSVGTSQGVWWCPFCDNSQAEGRRDCAKCGAVTVANPVSIVGEREQTLRGEMTPNRQVEPIAGEIPPSAAPVAKDPWRPPKDRAMPPAGMALLSDAQVLKGYRESAKKSFEFGEKRASLPPGSSRAKVTTANARWATYAEARDRYIQEWMRRYPDRPIEEAAGGVVRKEAVVSEAAATEAASQAEKDALITKWQAAKSRNSALAARDLERLRARGFDVSEADEALTTYKETVRKDFGGEDAAEEFANARAEAWDDFVSALDEVELPDVGLAGAGRAAELPPPAAGLGLPQDQALVKSNFRTIVKTTWHISEARVLNPSHPQALMLAG